MQPGEGPGRNELERLGIGVLDPRPLDVRVEVHDVDEQRAAPVGGLGGCAGELLLPDQGSDRHDLAFLDIRPVDGELRHGVKTVVHGRRSYSEREGLRVTIAQAIDRYLAAAGISASTRRAYGTDLRDFAEWYGDAGRAGADRRARPLGLHG